MTQLSTELLAATASLEPQCSGPTMVDEASPPSYRQRLPALPTRVRPLTCQAGPGRTGEHQERTAGAVRKLLGGASVDHASHRAIAARANDQQIERRAVER